MEYILRFSDVDILTIVRVTVAFVLGGVVGYERERVQRPAGLRTHMLVAAGSACFTLASVYGFAGLGGGPVDPSRVAAQIVTGIGFLGAGTILRTGATVRGLTTASSIWIVAAIGMAAGLGMIALAAYTTALTWFALRVVASAKGRRGSARDMGEPSITGGQPEEDE